MDSKQQVALRSLKESHVRFDEYLDLSEHNLRKSCRRLMSRLYASQQLGAAEQPESMAKRQTQLESSSGRRASECQWKQPGRSYLQLNFARRQQVKWKQQSQSIGPSSGANGTPLAQAWDATGAAIQDPVAKSHELTRRRFFERLNQRDSIRERHSDGAEQTKASGNAIAMQIQSSQNKEAQSKELAPTRNQDASSLKLSASNRDPAEAQINCNSGPEEWSGQRKGLQAQQSIGAFEIQVPSGLAASPRLLVRQVEDHATARLSRRASFSSRRPLDWQSQLNTRSISCPSLKAPPESSFHESDFNSNGSTSALAAEVGGHLEGAGGIVSGRQPEWVESEPHYKELVHFNYSHAGLYSIPVKRTHELAERRGSCSSSGFGASSEGSARLSSKSSQAKTGPSYLNLPASNFLLANQNYQPLGTKQASCPEATYANLNEAGQFEPDSANRKLVEIQQRLGPSSSSIDSGGFSRLAPIRLNEASLASRKSPAGAKSERRGSFLRWVARAFQSSSTAKEQNASEQAEVKPPGEISTNTRVQQGVSEDGAGLREADLVIMESPRQVARASQRRSRASRSAQRVCESGEFAASQASQSDFNLASARLYAIDCRARAPIYSTLASDSDCELGRARQRRRHARKERKSRRDRPITRGRLVSIEPRNGSQVIQLERHAHEEWPFAAAGGRVRGKEGVFVSRVKRDETLLGLVGVGDRILELDGLRVSGERAALWVNERLRKRVRVELKLAPFEAN